MPNFVSNYVSASNWLSDFFGGDTPEFPLSYFQIATRAAALYLAGVIIVRLGKSRLLSRATPLDVILGFILGSLLSRGMTGHAALSDTIVASAALVAFHWLFSAIACRSPAFDTLLKGHVYPLIENSRQRDDNMSRSHISEADLAEAMRLGGIDDRAQVDAAFKERNGEISFIKKNHVS